MKNKIIYLSIIGALAFTPGCDLLDPTEVINPNLTKDNILKTNNPMTGWVLGMERQLAIVLNEQLTVAEIASDNYDNTATYFNQNLDPLNLIFTDTDINNLQFTIADLRESAVFGLTEVKAVDPKTTLKQEAELYFYKGYAELLAGELFVALPAEPNGAALPPAENLNLAIADFKKALEVVELDTTDVTDNKASYNLALARAYHRVGDKTNAAAHAQAAIASNPAYTRFVRFDNPQGLTSDMELGLFDRNTFDDLQPLPRLDFLDPKYHGTGATDQPVAIQKIEEAHLILAEVALADNSLGQAKTHLKNTLAVVNTRPRETFSDIAEGRTQDKAGSRPNMADILVAASPGDPFLPGLVLERPATDPDTDPLPTITVPAVSGTSLTAIQIDLLLSADAALEKLYLMRQEIFIAEGRRMADLGIRFPVSEVESLSNSNITTANTTGYAPAFVKDKPLDAFTYNAATKTAVITVNMNKVLVENKTSPDVLPFH
jgi:tetratricopeptide (TPR) repeat protein